MRTFIGVTLIVLGIALGLYLGIWVMFIGGFVQVINVVKATPVEALPLAIGVARVIFSGFVGWGVAIVCFGIGKALL